MLTSDISICTRTNDLVLSGPRRLHLVACQIIQFWRASIPLRFLLVGGVNFVFGYLVFAVLYWSFSGHWPDAVIVTVATVIGITESYLAHRFLTYRARGTWWREYLRFYVVYGAQYVVNLVAIWIFVTRLSLNAYVVQFVISVLLTVVSYWAHKNYSFRK